MIEGSVRRQESFVPFAEKPPNLKFRCRLKEDLGPVQAPNVSPEERDPAAPEDEIALVNSYVDISNRGLRRDRFSPEEEA